MAKTISTDNLFEILENSDFNCILFIQEGIYNRVFMQGKVYILANILKDNYLKDENFKLIIDVMNILLNNDKNK